MQDWSGPLNACPGSVMLEQPLLGAGDHWASTPRRPYRTSGSMRRGLSTAVIVILPYRGDLWGAVPGALEEVAHRHVGLERDERDGLTSIVW